MSEALPSEYEREIRRLRFEDAGLEHAFQNDYARRSIPQLRPIFWFTVFIQAPLAIRALVQDGMGLADARFWLRILSGLVPGVLGLLLTRSPRFKRWSQTYMAFQALLIGGTGIFVFGAHPLASTRLMTVITAACILFTLRARTAALVVGVLIAGYVGLSLAVIHKTASGLVDVCLIAFVALFGAYLMESLGPAGLSPLPGPGTGAGEIRTVAGSTSYRSPLRYG